MLCGKLGISRLDFSNFRVIYRFFCSFRSKAFLLKKYNKYINNETIYIDFSIEKMMSL